MAEHSIPTDLFSRRRRELLDNPGVIRSASTVMLQDFYGNDEAWIVETFRTETTVEALIQKNSVDGSLRLVLPPKVMEALARQRGSIVTAARKRGAVKALATKRAEGQPIGNVAALRRSKA